jgi:uncharacterized protein YbjT (DUF2867 family)
MVGATYPRRVLVAGGTSGVGRLAVARLVGLGSEVRVLTRDGARASSLGAVGVVEGTLLSPMDCARAVAGCDAVVCTAGDYAVPTDRPLVDGDGIVNLADAAAAEGARRFVLVSSLGVGDSWKPLPFFAKWLFRWRGDLPILEAKARSEDHLRSLDLDWTIFRPGYLTNSMMRGEPVALEGLVPGLTTRHGTADVSVRALASPGSIGKVLAVCNRGLRFAVLHRRPHASRNISWLHRNRSLWDGDLLSWAPRARLTRSKNQII